MGFWDWFSSERRIREALEKSSGYDISPVNISPPANTDDPPKGGEKRLTLWTDYTYEPKESDKDDHDNIWANIDIRK
ncbi:MAG: hypothetical protein V1721_10020 [Pseudomonadota bacterium]